MTGIGKIVLLSGPPRAGKSSLAQAVQRLVPGIWLNLGVDVMMRALPEALLPGIGLRPGGERPDLEPHILSLYRALFQSIAAHARQGLDVVADLGLHEDYSADLPVFAVAAEALAELSPLLVGVSCDLEEIMRRRNADPQGLYLGGETAPPPVLRWQAIHTGRDYDLKLDMGQLSSEEGAHRVATLLAAPPRQPVLTARSRPR